MICAKWTFWCFVWKLPSAETITCVVPNAFRTLELFVLSSEIEFEAFSKQSWNQAGAKRTCFVERKLGVPLRRPPPPPLSVPEISTSALEYRVLPSETKSVRGDLSGGDIEVSLISNRERLRHTDSRSADSYYKIPYVQSTLSRRPRALIRSVLIRFQFSRLVARRARRLRRYRLRRGPPSAAARASRGGLG